MTIPSDLASVVNDLAVAQKRVAYFEEKLAGKVAAEEDVKRLRARLLHILDQLGFPEEAVDLLLAARNE